MKIDVYFTPAHVDESQIRDRVVVVIDVLRAATSIATALFNGAREIIPVQDVETALKIHSNLGEDVALLCGERNGKIIEGFDLGNSPLEYSREKVEGKVLIFSTTNGTVAITKAKQSKELVVGSFVNLSAVAKYISDRPETDVAIICAGKLNMFSLEDAVCAGMIIDQLEVQMSLPVALADGSRAAQVLYKRFERSISKLLQTTDHGKYLSEIGFEKDLEVCATVDSVPVLPVLVDNRVLKIYQSREDTER
ncbi:MAG: 2-phosphosulfolactate phosphatase [Bacteroidota bacterium]